MHTQSAKEKNLSRRKKYNPNLQVGACRGNGFAYKDQNSKSYLPLRMANVA
jgi:hypothetical protein